MASENQIIFESTELPRSSFYYFEDMKVRQEFCDITFAFGSRPVSAHRIIVTAAIPYLRDKLSNNAALCGEAEIALSDIEPDALLSLIEFAYTRKVTINMENVKPLLTGACRMQVGEVRKACCDFLADRLTPENVFDILDFANCLDCSELLEDIESYVSEYFEELSQMEDFLYLSSSFVKRVIERDDLRTSREEKVFETIVKWVNEFPEERKDDLVDLLSKVRWLSVDPRYVRLCASEVELVRTSVTCRDLLDEVRDRHSFPDHIKTTATFPTQPRWLTKNVLETSSQEKGNVYVVEAELECTVSNYGFVEVKGKICSSKWVFDEKVNLASYYMYSTSEAELCNKQFFFNPGVAIKRDPVKGNVRSYYNGRRTAFNAGVVFLNNKIYLCGGTDGVSATKHVDCFDSENVKWKSVGDMHACREYPGVTTSAHYIYVVGGRDDLLVHDSVEKFDPQTGKWRLMVPMLTKRFAPGCAVLNGKVYVCGGITSVPNEECVATAEVYDPMENKWKFIAPMNTARSHFQLLSLNGKLVAQRSRKELRAQRRECMHNYETYDPKTNEWTEVKRILELPGSSFWSIMLR